MARALRDGRSRAVRYVSIGCGSLLTDFEILCGLQMKGLTIEAISLVDAEYKLSGSGVTPNGTPYTGTGELKGGGPAIQALSDFFPGARVSAFDAISSLRHAVVEYPEVYGSATTVVGATQPRAIRRGQGARRAAASPGRPLLCAVEQRLDPQAQGREAGEWQIGRPQSR